jgi:SAM-dependent methyltransferase
MHNAASQPETTQSSYLFPNRDPETPVRFAALSQMFDDISIQHLIACGVTTGWACLEVGAGGGSIANWLANRVGGSGYVLATDIDPCFLESVRLANVEVQRHDVVVDVLPQRAFDLVHSRLVLHHLPQREKALQNMISALKPGGWILVEDHDSASIRPDPTAGAGERLLKAQLAAWKVLDDAGVNRGYGRQLFGRLRAYGLTECGASARAFMWEGGSAGIEILRANFQQLRDAMISRNYITEEEFEQDVVRLDDPNFMVPSGILWSAWGRRL